MKKRKAEVAIYISYAACVIMVISFFLYTCVNMKNNVFSERAGETFRKVAEYTSVKTADENAPLGVKSKYMMQFTDIARGGGSLVFYSIHQDVEVYIGNELVYDLRPSDENLFGKTPGNNWNTILLSKEDNRKKIEVILTPVYESSIGQEPEFYVGSRYLIWISIFKENFLPVLISALAIVFGVIFLVFTLINRNNPETDGSLAMMGIFSIMIGTWKMADISAMSLLFQFSIPLAAVPFLALMLVEVPFFLYVRCLFSRKNSIMWYLPCFFSVFVSVLSLGLQIFRIADLRETLWMNHVVMVLMIVVFFYMLLRERRKVGWNKQLRILVKCVLVCVLGLAVDITSYYMTKGSSMMIFGMAAFLVYIIVLGVRSLRENKRLVKMAVNAKKYERMAYHDQLTGVFNRTAYAEFIGRKGFSPEGCIVVMFDLNNLKKCNDTFGHEKGDRYIKYSARLIVKVFGDIGNCYRMGGDEFCVLLKGISVAECRKRIALLRKAADASNRRNPDEFPIQIASGYEEYDKTLDYDLGDTLRRADKMMYHEKFVMKQHTAS